MAFARSCVIAGPRFYLNADTVDWSMKIGSGNSCVHGLKFSSFIIQNVKLISPPQSGQVELLGSGFTYTAKPDFTGQDSFSLAISGVFNQINGHSIVNVKVSVVQANASTGPSH